LKRSFIPYAKELLQQTSLGTWNHRKVKDYNIQVNPREINLFYIEDNYANVLCLKTDL
jgi:hypothetical protein